MRYVIVAMTDEGGTLQYFAGDGYKANLLQASRFRTEKDDARRVQASVHCRRIIESGARVEIRRLSSAA